MRKEALRIGITGGIGVGKTTVCRLFETLGIPVYYADTAAKNLLEHDPELRTSVIRLLGVDAYRDGHYNRAYVAQKIFGQPELLQQLNRMVHPAVETHSRAWHETHQDAPYTLKEAALMIESGSHRFLDALIVVTAPEALRIERVMSRDGLTEAEVRARIARQLPEQDKIALADFAVENDGQHALIPQVWAIHQQLLNRHSATRCRTRAK